MTIFLLYFNKNMTYCLKSALVCQLITMNSIQYKSISKILEHKLKSFKTLKYFL